MQNESISLAFVQNGSDKVYHCQLESSGDGYTVNFQFGRRGNALSTGSKTAEPLPYEKAKKVYDALVKSKIGKGYSPGDAGTPFVGTENAGRVSGIDVQLSNAITESDVQALLRDPDWVAQEKIDGVRRPFQFGIDPPLGVNKKGLTVALPCVTAYALNALNMDAGRTTLDAELVGEVLYVFDVLELYDADVRAQPLGKRLDILEALSFNDNVRLLPTARTTAQKVALLERVKRDNGEGVVFKRLGAAYSPGRPNSMGDSRKFKLVESVTVRCVGVNPGKRSVGIEMRDAEGNCQSVGNVTIPPSATLPQAGDLLEILYLYAMPGGALIQPVYKSARADQDDADCISQLKLKRAPLAA